jgi:ribonuclease HI
MDQEAHWSPAPAKALLFVHVTDAAVGHISELMHEHAPHLGALQVDRDPDDGIFIFHKKPNEYFAAGKKWESKEYEDPILQQIAHNGIWVPASTGKLPAVDFVPRMQALLPNLLPSLRDSLLSQLQDDPSSYAKLLSCSVLKETPSFRPHYGNGIVVVLKNEVDFRVFTSTDCILSDTCGRRPIPFVSKKEVFVPRLNSKKGCLTCGANHRMTDCQLHKQYIISKAAVIQRAMVGYYKLSHHILNYLDPLPEEVLLPENDSANPTTTPSDMELDSKESDKKKRKPVKEVKELKQTSITSFTNKAAEQYTGLGLDQLYGGGSEDFKIASANDDLKPSSFFLKTNSTIRAFSLFHTTPDGNCFFYSINHLQSPVRHLLPGSVQLIRAECYRWCLQNKSTLDLITRKAFGDASSDEILQRLEQDRAWTNYPIIILTALTFQIDILVISPGRSLNLLVSDFCAAKRISFPPAKANVILLFHEYGSDLNVPNSTADHFSLLIPDNQNEISLKQLLEELRVTMQIADAICLSSSEDEVVSNEVPEHPKLPRTEDPVHDSAVNSPPKKKRKKKRSNRKRKHIDISSHPPHQQSTQQSVPTPPLIRKVNPPEDPQQQNTTDCVNVLSWNCTSLNVEGRFKSLLELSRDIDIICIQETALLQPPQEVAGYNIEFNNGTIRPRGILALIKEDIVYVRRKDIENRIAPLETIALEFAGTNGKWLLIEVYFNPGEELPDAALIDGLETIRSLDIPTVVCGDFNSPGFSFGGDNVYPSKRGSLLDSFLLFNDYYCMHSQFDFTFFRGDDTRSCLDGVITSHSAAAFCHSLLLPPIAPGHLPYIVSVSLGCQLSSLSRELNISRIDSNFFDWIQFMKEMDKHEVSKFHTIEDVRSFIDHVKESQLKSVRIPNARYKNEGWWNDICRAAWKERNKALKKLQKCRPHTNPAKFKRRKHEYNKAKKKMQKIFREQKARWKQWTINQASSSSSSKIWKVISKLCGSKHARKKIPVCTLKQEKAQALSEELCKSFEEIQSAPDLSSLSDSIPLPPISKPILVPDTEKITEWEIDQALYRVKTKSCPGFDNIKVHTLLRLWNHPKWKTQLLTLMNALYRDPSLFTPFKHAIIHPIPKPGRNNAFRPISLLSQLGKIIERVLAQRIQLSLDIPNQFGCTPHRSTRDALVRLQHWAVQACHGALSIFFDVSKAYDRVIPKLVISKLAKISGISAHVVHWVFQFLSNRTFQVRLNGRLSQTIGRPLFGLPQGSPLSVVLWKVFISDIPIEKDDNIFMDDINWNIDEPSYEEAEEVANMRLRKLDTWAKRNGVIFDKDKTKVLVHESCTEVHLVFHPSDTKYIPLVTKYRYLGTWLNQRNDVDLGFSLETQFKKEKSEFSRRMAWIKCLWSAPLYIRRTAYIALVRSKLAYSLPLTIRNYSEELEILQTKALRIVAQAPTSTPGDRLRYLLRIPSCLSLAKSQAIHTRANMLAYGGLLADDYNYWIEKEEGINNQETPFGLIQSESLVDMDNIFFLEYQPLNRSQLNALASISIYCTNISELPIEDEYLSCYTDGSFNPISKSGGVGIHWPQHPDGSGNPLSICQKYSPVWNSFNCELLAIRDALKSLEVFPADAASAKQIFIFTDCLSVIRTLAGILRTPWTQRRHPVIIEILNLIVSVQKKYEITISWVKGHSGVSGNEMADSLAKNAASVESEAQLNFIDRDFLLGKARLLCKFHPPPGLSTLPCSSLRALTNQEHPKVGSMIIRILSNHYFLKGCHYNRSIRSRQPGVRRLRKLKSSESLPVAFACRYCSEEPETVEHVVNNCRDTAVESTRFVLRRQVWSAKPFPSPNTLLQNIISTPSTWKHLFDFFQYLNLLP